MLLTAQYSNHMRIGQGFNSYTHETRIDGAVKVDSPQSEATKGLPGQLRDSGIDMMDQSPPISQVHRTGRTPLPQGLSPNSTIDRSRSAPANAVRTSAHSREGSNASDNPPYHIARPEAWDSHQSVTYSSWQIDSVSEIADALNISSYALVKYATVESNVNAAMVHEQKLSESQLNYMVSVKVTNESKALQEAMDFQPIDNLPPERFTQVYGDCFISDFLEGGEFQAIISIKINDKSKLNQVKEAVDFQLSVPPVSGLDIGAGEKVDSRHTEAFRNTETTISIRCNGGGVIKDPSAKWTINTVVAIANAFPSMVASYPSKTSAILTKYSSLRSFQEWKWKMYREPSWSDFVKKDDHWENRLILSYAPCKVYTAALFEDLMKFKKLQRRLKDMMENPTSYKTREPLPEMVENPDDYNMTPSSEITPLAPVRTDTAIRVNPRLQYKRDPFRSNTFELGDPDLVGAWNLREINKARHTVSTDVADLKKADLVCRAALTLITEEAARLVDHPDLAYAEFDDSLHRIRINRPNYPMPELLDRRLPMYVGNDAAEDVMGQDKAIMMTMKYAHANDLYFHIVGDLPNANRSYMHFTSLEHSEKRGVSKRMTGLSLHSYNHSAWKFSSFSRGSHAAIGALGFSFGHDTRNGKAVLEQDKPSVHAGGRPRGGLDMRKVDLSSTRGVSQIEICYVPGSGRIAALTFFEATPGHEAPMPTLQWRQWDHDESDGREPGGLKKVVQGPPNDGSRWEFVGLCGSFDHSFWGKVLSRVSGVWRRT